MQREIVDALPLHGPEGQLNAEGWARHPWWRYQRDAVPASVWRIKEWDYYAVVSPAHFAITFTASNLGYAGLFAVCFVDLQSGRCWQVDDLELLPLGRHAFPEVAAEGEIRFTSKKLSLHFVSSAGQRVLRFSCRAIQGPNGSGLEGEIHLTQPAGMESMNIVTSWAENRKAFYHNTKINCLAASGHFTLGGQRFELQPQRDLAVLDWGRGVWTYRNTWYWSSASGFLDGVPFGFNLGYGFSDRTPASENLLFYAGRAHKLDLVEFHFDPSDWLKPWRVTSNDARLQLSFRPAVDRNSHLNLLVIASEQHQVFGYFSGVAVLDGGQTLTLVDFPGFAEEVRNRW
jgi:hypothetical protein